LEAGTFKVQASKLTHALRDDMHEQRTSTATYSMTTMREREAKRDDRGQGKNKQTHSKAEEHTSRDVSRMHAQRRTRVRFSGGAAPAVK